MRAIVQKVEDCHLFINEQLHSSVNKGLLVLLGITHDDNQTDIIWLSNKILNLRIFDDNKGVMNLSVRDKCYGIMIVSQFTLHASTKKGNRPSYLQAAGPDTAIPIYESFIWEMKNQGEANIVTGIFGANMDIAFTNKGPVTIFLDTKNKE